MAHRLDPLLRPRSVAVYGASERPYSVGRRTVHNLITGKFEGPIYPINPGRDEVLGLKCYPNLDALPEPAEHIIFCVSDARIEAALRDAIEHGARAATIMSQLLLADDTEPPLNDRVARMVEESGLLLCGPNGMGFYNCHDGVWVCGFDTRDNHARGGNVTLVSQSGSGMSGISSSRSRWCTN
jgi:acyl-CoA synthetase (NDP forming)